MFRKTSADKLQNECKQKKQKVMPNPSQASYKSTSSSSSSSNNNNNNNNNNNSSMKLTVVAEVKNFSVFYEIRMFMTVSIRTS